MTDMLRFILLLPFLIVLVAFALSNQQVVALGLWPTDIQLEVPLSISVLVAAGLFFFLGALFVWFGSVAARARAARAEKRAASLEAELKARSAAPPITNTTRMNMVVPALAGPK
jgi:uncharacterized membrane protein YciS (DUF1049 family)